MRSYLVFVLLLAMGGVFVVLQVTRQPERHQVTVRAATSVDAGPGSGAGVQTDAGRRHEASKRGKRGKRAPDKKAAPRMKRPLRVASLGWELLAPGVVANGGATPGKDSLFRKERLDVQLMAFRSLEELEAALARGGADPLGADVAIAPLPELVSALERLRALAPRIFLVLGWSHGRDGLMAASDVSLTRLPRGRPSLIGQRGAAETFFALFMLELAGVPASRVRLLEPKDKLSKTAQLAAMERPLPSGVSVGDRKFVVTTADATRLVPLVAVAPEGLVKSHGDALAAWGQVWMEGVERLQRDVPTAARQVAALKEAPHALDLLKRLGQIDPAPLMDNARLAGLSGRSALTLAELFRRSWQIWRESGVLSSPMPEQIPVYTGIMAAMVHTYPEMVEADPARTGPASKADKEPAREELHTLLTYEARGRRPDAAALQGEVAFLAEVFGRAHLEVSVRGGLKKARALVEATTSRYDITHPGRITAVAHHGNRAARVTIRVGQ